MKKIFILTTVCFVASFFTADAQVKKISKKNSKKEVKSTIKTEAIKEVENENLVWYTNVFKADSVSKKTNKPIFGFFTGSDWCGWCHRLQANVFAKQEFIKWAKEKVVLLELDFPRRKQLPQDIQQQNAGLQQAFQVQGYPTVWIFNIVKDSTGNNVKLNPFGSLGYPNGTIPGKEEVTFLASANEILNKVK